MTCYDYNVKSCLSSKNGVIFHQSQWHLAALPALPPPATRSTRPPHHCRGRRSWRPPGQPGPLALGLTVPHGERLLSPTKMGINSEKWWFIDIRHLMWIYGSWVGWKQTELFGFGLIYIKNHKELIECGYKPTNISGGSAQVLHGKNVKGHRPPCRAPATMLMISFEYAKRNPVTHLSRIHTHTHTWYTIYYISCEIVWNCVILNCFSDFRYCNDMLLQRLHFCIPVWCGQQGQTKISSC